MPGDFRWTCGDYARVFIFITHEAAGALGTRHSPRPLSGGRFLQNSGASRRENAESYLSFVATSLRGANATKQSMHRHSGMVRRTRPQMCNRTSGNLEIPGSMLRIAPE